MGVVSYEMEIKSPVPPCKLFKAIVLDGSVLIPNLLPQAMKSIEVTEGDGSPGTIKLVTFAEGSPCKYMKERCDAIDKEKYYYAYSMIEGDALAGRIEKISNEIKFVASPSGGSICKTSSSFYTIGNHDIKQEEIKAGKEMAVGILRAIEAFILANPDA